MTDGTNTGALPLGDVPAPFVAPVRQDKQLRAIKLYADGRRRDLGLISYSSRNPIKHHVVNAWIKLKVAFRGEV